MKVRRKKSTEEGKNIVWSAIVEGFVHVMNFISHLFH